MEKSSRPTYSFIGGEMMDTSEIYVKMCDCPEIQEQWKSKDGDWASSERDGAVPVFPPTRILGQVLGRYRHDHIWLPRQDQIDDMMGVKGLCLNWISFLRFYVGSDWIITDYGLKFSDWIITDYGLKFKTQEQLKLAFYMHEKHNLIWEKDKWVKE